MDIDEIIGRLERDGEAYQRGCETLDYEGALRRTLERLGLADTAHDAKSGGAASGPLA